MEKNMIKGHVYNPYRFIENPIDKEKWNSFLMNQGFPSSWTIREVKLAWAFQGIMGKPITAFDKNADYIVYAYEPYITAFGDTLEIALANSESVADSHYNHKTKGNWAILNLKNEYCSLSKEQKSLLQKHGHNIEDGTKIIIDLEKALEIAGNTSSANFRVITRLSGKTDVFSALCNVFQIPDIGLDYYPRDALRFVFTNNGQLYSPALEWLDNWVEDENLRTHFSCFMEKKRGLRDRRDIHLTSHFSKDWNIHLPCGGSFPYGLDALSFLKNTSCLLGWEWEYGDMVESVALVQVN